jgi:DNA replication protein DnaC
LLTHPTHETLRALKLDGMAEAFAELIADGRSRSPDPVEWIGLMLDREQARRGTRRFQSRLRAAKLRHSDACMEDVNYRTPRGLDRALFQSLGSTEWIDRHRSVLISGPCGVGKSWLACALGHAALNAPSSTTGCPGSSPSSNLPGAMAGSSGCSANSPAPIC